MSTKGCVGYFLLWLDFELFAKIKKDMVSTHLVSRSKQNKKNLAHPSVDITK